jgi:hypothetical protein
VLPFFSVAETFARVPGSKIALPHHMTREAMTSRLEWWLSAPRGLTALLVDGPLLLLGLAMMLVALRSGQWWGVQLLALILPLVAKLGVACLLVGWRRAIIPTSA